MSAKEAAEAAVKYGQEQSMAHQIVELKAENYMLKEVITGLVREAGRILNK